MTEKKKVHMDARRTGRTDSPVTKMLERAKARFLRGTSVLLTGIALAGPAGAGLGAGLATLGTPSTAQALERRGISAPDLTLSAPMVELERRTAAAHYNDLQVGGVWRSREVIPGEGRVPADATYSNHIVIPTSRGRIELTAYLGARRTTGSADHVTYSVYENGRTDPVREGEFALHLGRAMQHLGFQMEGVVWTVEERGTDRPRAFLRARNAAGETGGVVGDAQLIQQFPIDLSGPISEITSNIRWAVDPGSPTTVASR